jgi:membrane protein required for colicin V production
VSGSGLSAVDILAILLLAAFALFGFLRGMVRLVFGFAALILGWSLALRLCEPVGRRLQLIVSSADGAGGFEGYRVAGFALVFMAVTIAAALLAWFITRALEAVKLGCLNRLAGASLGLLLGILVICAATVPLLALASPDGGFLTKDSRLAPYAVAGGEYLKLAAPEPLRQRFTAAAAALLRAGEGLEKKLEEGAAGVTAPKPVPSPRPR